MRKGLLTLLLMLSFAAAADSEVMIESNDTGVLSYCIYDLKNLAMIQFDSVDEVLYILIEDGDEIIFESRTFIADSRLAPGLKLLAKKKLSYNSADVFLRSCGAQRSQVDRAVADLTHALANNASDGVVESLRSAVEEAFIMWFACILH